MTLAPGWVHTRRLAVSLHDLFAGEDEPLGVDAAVGLDESKPPLLVADDRGGHAGSDAGDQAGPTQLAVDGPL